MKNSLNWAALVKTLWLVILVGVVTISEAQKMDVIIPKPSEIHYAEGNAFFSFNQKTSIVTDKEFLSDAKIFAGYLNRVTGFIIPVKDRTDQPSTGTRISLRYTTDDAISKEGYIMAISEKGIDIKASHSAGAYYGCMSLLQLIHADTTAIPSQRIEDRPRFAWRGLMLDCSRTFISLGYLRKTIDRMSFYKLNTLHLHLTDDQGWRLQIKGYPLLTSKGAYFDSTYHEPAEFQGYYTQSQMKQLVEYARERHVTIVPEIECPGHSQAALYAYPGLSCSGNIGPVFPFFAGPTVTSSVFSPVNENTYLFFKNVIREVAEVFHASGYIHLGGDEVPENAWNGCKGYGALMDSLGFKDQAHLEGYMMNRVGNNVLSLNKRPIGWDEVFREGIGKKWVIMVWRGEGRGVEEVKEGYDVIVCPLSYLYFNADYSYTPTKKVYSFEPVPDGTTEAERKHYVGMEACFWSHIDRTETKIDYQLYPRVLALAERAWSPKSVTDYNDFLNRGVKNEYWLNFFDIKYMKE